MSSKCRVCGQYGHTEGEHSAFKMELPMYSMEELRNLQAKNERLRKMVEDLILEVQKRANAGNWWSDTSVYELTKKYEQALKGK